MDVLAQALDFIAQDPDGDPQGVLGALVHRARDGDAAAHAELADRFSAPLTFGTAGLRGRVEAGLSRMNRVVVIHASYGLGQYLLANRALGAATRGVVIAFDGRYSSRQFAEDTAAVLSGLGIVVHLFDDPMPTPVCAFAVTHLGAAAGVMVTASHNPPKDNGYKVYWENGAQIIPPHDVGIAACIAQAPKVGAITRPSPMDAVARGLRRAVPDTVLDAYLQGVRAASFHADTKGPPLRLCYTAMHGVGARCAVRVLRAAGFDGVAVVPSQTDPDGAFRTVDFPNPEEKGALDEAYRVANASDAELILANDPDADRLAVAVKLEDGTWRQLSGNEVGILLAAHALEHGVVPAGAKRLVITTLVSSTFLSRMAANVGAAYAETLTGFKWIANEAIRRADQGEAMVLGYEEALGYSVGPLVRDKDGIGAAVRFAEMARALKARGQSIPARLDALMVQHGASHGTSWNVVLPGRDGMAAIKGTMAALRKSPPATLDGSAVVRTLDLEEGVEVGSDGVRKPAALPRSDVLQYHAQDGTRLTVRPSGTEPKIKFYLELTANVGSAGELPAARQAMDARSGRIRAALKAALGVG